MTRSEKRFCKKSAKKRPQNVKCQYMDPMDTDYKRLQYVRYADDWICGIIGSKEDAENIKSDIINLATK